MKISVLILIVSFIVVPTSVNSQDLLEKHPDALAYKEKIDTDTTLRPIILENEEFLEHIDHGGELIGYYRDSVIVKVTTTVYYSHGVEKVNYYVADSKVRHLLFMEESFDMYPYNEEIGEFEYSKAYINFYGQYIFKDGKLVDQISTGHNRFEDDTIDIERTVRSELRFYMDMIVKKNAQ
jgi:hypothetical protein